MAQDETATLDYPNNCSEPRVSRLEEEVSTLRVHHAEISTDLKHLSIQVQEATARLADKLETTTAHLASNLQATASRLSDKIDFVLKPLTETLHTHIQEDTLSRVKIDGIGSVVSHLQAAEQARVNRAANWKKAVGSVFLGAGAIGAKELIMFIVNSFRHI